MLGILNGDHLGVVVHLGHLRLQADVHIVLGVPLGLTDPETWVLSGLRGGNHVGKGGAIVRQLRLPTEEYDLALLVALPDGLGSHDARRTGPHDEDPALKVPFGHFILADHTDQDEGISVRPTGPTDFRVHLGEHDLTAYDAFPLAHFPIVGHVAFGAFGLGLGLLCCPLVDGLPAHSPGKLPPKLFTLLLIRIRGPELELQGVQRKLNLDLLQALVDVLNPLPGPPKRAKAGGILVLAGVGVEGKGQFPNGLGGVPYKGRDAEQDSLRLMHRLLDFLHVGVHEVVQHRLQPLGPHSLGDLLCHLARVPVRGDVGYHHPFLDNGLSGPLVVQALQQLDVLLDDRTVGAGDSLDREVPDLVHALPHPAFEWGEDAIVIFLVGLDEYLVLPLGHAVVKHPWVAQVSPEDVAGHQGFHFRDPCEHGVGPVQKGGHNELECVSSDVKGHALLVDWHSLEGCPVADGLHIANRGGRSDKDRIWVQSLDEPSGGARVVRLRVVAHYVVQLGTPKVVLEAAQHLLPERVVPWVPGPSGGALHGLEEDILACALEQVCIVAGAMGCLHNNVEDTETWVEGPAPEHVVPLSDPVLPISHLFGVVLRDVVVQEFPGEAQNVIRHVHVEGRDHFLHQFRHPTLLVVLSGVGDMLLCLLVLLHEPLEELDWVSGRSTGKRLQGVIDEGRDPLGLEV
mmetsp:Transcript_88647/g.153867  ORF Transcript_88647/g.153867 Transcript_88647/m.153867 type:complete len:684 (+) Transcript_88647:1526-3577(+)